MRANHNIFSRQEEDLDVWENLLDYLTKAPDTLSEYDTQEYLDRYIYDGDQNSYKHLKK